LTAILIDGIRRRYMYLLTPAREHIEFRSTKEWRGWPLVHVSFGGIGADGQQLRCHARGIIAIGDTATGLIAVGAFARGVVAIGADARGVVAIGAFAVGLVTIASMGLGLVVIGAYAVGMSSIGVFSVGLSTAGFGAFPLLQHPWHESLLTLFGSLVPFVVIPLATRRRGLTTG
jgi:hypothetical protein